MAAPPQLVFWHLEKAGGSSVLSWLKELNVSIKKVVAEHMVFPPEYFAENYFRIGLMREPCSYAVSEYMWGRRLGSFEGRELPGTGAGFMRYALSGQGHADLYNGDVKEGFRKWLRFIHSPPPRDMGQPFDRSPQMPPCGLLAMRFWTQVVNASAAARINAYRKAVLPCFTIDPKTNTTRPCPKSCPLADCVRAAPAELLAACAKEVPSFNISRFDCWLRTEQLADDFVACMNLYQARGGRPELAVTRLRAVVNRSWNVDKSAHLLSCERMYVNETRTLVWHADGGVARLFGYTGCCQPAASRAQREILDRGGCQIPRT